MAYAKIPSIKNNKSRKEALEKKLERHGAKVQELRNNPAFKKAVREIVERTQRENPDASIDDILERSQKTMIDIAKNSKGK